MGIIVGAIFQQSFVGSRLVGTRRKTAYDPSQLDVEQANLDRMTV